MLVLIVFGRYGLLESHSNRIWKVIQYIPPVCVSTSVCLSLSLSLSLCVCESYLGVRIHTRYLGFLVGSFCNM